MPKLTFKVPAYVRAPQQTTQNHDHIATIGISGVAGIMAIVALVLVLGQAIDTQTAAAVANICGPGITTGNPTYADQLDQIGYRCSNPGPSVWCCYKE